jgi:predicted nucleic acid-binding protein
MSAADKVFLDTNVIVYADDRSEPVKGPQAQALLLQLFALGRPLPSIQVLNEFYWASTRRIPRPLSHVEAADEVARLQRLGQVADLTWPIVEKALRAIPGYGLSLWDALIFAAATASSATHVLSEDFQDGRTIDGITFLNPFAVGFDLNRILGS